MTKIILYGHLKDAFAEEYDLEVKSPREAIVALCRMIPTFKTEFLKTDYHLLVGDPLGNFIDLDDTEIELITERNIHLIPAVDGSRSEVLKFVLAAALIAAAFIPGIGTFAQAFLLNAGVAMGLSGVSALLAPSQKSSNSYVFTGEQTTITQGNAIPLAYGTVYIDLAPISASISNETTGNTDENLQYGGVSGWTSIDNAIANPFNTSANSGGNLF